MVLGRDVWLVGEAVVAEILPVESSCHPRYFALFWRFFHSVCAELWLNLYPVVVLDEVPGSQKKMCLV